MHKRPTMRKSEKSNESEKSIDYKQELQRLQQELKRVDDIILNDDDDSPESSWRMMKLALGEQIKTIQAKIIEVDNEKIANFLHKAANNRRKSDKDNRKIFNLAKQDAEQRVFSIVALHPEEIAQCFSTGNFFIDPRGAVRPPKFMYSWYHDLNNKENNAIPLTPGIETPKKKNPTTGEIYDIQFLVSFFYSDPVFVQKCKDYYKPYGINITIQKDNKISKKWWIKLKIENEENKIFFP